MARSFLKAQLFVSVAGLLAVSSPGFAQDAAKEIYKPANDVEAKAQAVLGKALFTLPPRRQIGEARKTRQRFW